MDDQAIITLFWSRDEAAIRETENRYGRYCHTIAFNVLASQEDAAECVNDTWLKAWQAIPPARPGCLSAWLGKVTRNLALQRLQAKQAHKRGGGQADLVFNELEEIISSHESPEENVAALELAAAISDYLRTLPEVNRHAFIGRYFLFHDMQALAKHLGIRCGKLATRLHRTRQGLRRHLQERGFLI